MEGWSALFSAPNVTLGTIVGGFVISIAIGWLIPRRIHRDRIEDLRSQINDTRTERDMWREAYRTAEDGRVIAAQQSEELLDGMQTVKAVLLSLPVRGDGNGRE